MDLGQHLYQYVLTNPQSKEGQFKFRKFHKQLGKVMENLQYQVGVGKIDITPDYLIRLSGYLSSCCCDSYLLSFPWQR